MTHYEKRAAEILAGMTDKEKVGQVFLAHCPDGGGKEIFAEYQFGGVLAFAREFEKRTPEEARALFAGQNSVSKLPLLVAVDEEGGTVVRVSKFEQYRKERFPSPKDLFAAGGWRGIAGDTREKCALLRSVGINYNLAPVCDYSLDETAFISKRVFGRSAEETARFISSVVRTMKKEKIACSLKHFPGYGGNSDTHLDMACDVRPFEAFEKEDLLPFIAGIKAGAHSVMVAHNIVNCIDPEYPASLSIPVHKLLRETLGFRGVIITDSLTMNAIRHFTNGADPCVRALLCGNDMLITATTTKGADAVYEALQSGELPREVLDRAVTNVLIMKQKIGILH